MSDRSAELKAWEMSAPSWTLQAERIATMTRGATEALLAALAPRFGERILDVAAGPGDPALELAGIVGPDGCVTATDGVPEMLAALRQRAHERGLVQLRIVAQAAEELELPAASHDAACCRFGIMFFHDPLEGLRRMRRIVRPGGRLVLVVWGEREHNPFFSLAMDALDDVGAPAAEPLTGSRTVFEFSEPDSLAALVRASGWTQVAEARQDISMPTSLGRDEHLLDLYLQISQRVAERHELLAPPQREALRALIAERSAVYFRDGRFALPARISIVTGRSP